ncbi:MAG TPA: hypothetical protein VE153_20695, partial [Myxococcus sp.]|nr:hypothetical protein [Myxococcus sp.]
MIRRLLGACIGAVVVAGWACGGSDEPTPPPPPVDDGIQEPDERPGNDAGTGQPDAGTVPDAGPDVEPQPDAGTHPEPDGGTNPQPDGGTNPQPDGGTGSGNDGGTTEPKSQGPWPTDGVTNLSAKYGIRRVKSVGVDAAHNVWLLDGASIGVLRADSKQVVWTSQAIGQARQGFGPDKLATGSSVICGGKAGEAYVGYTALNNIPDGKGQRIAGRGEPDFDPVRYEEFKKGDLDVVRLNDAGNDVELTVHMHPSAGSSRPSVSEPLGQQNTNDYHFDEDRSVYS